VSRALRWLQTDSMPPSMAPLAKIASAWPHSPGHIRGPPQAAHTASAAALSSVQAGHGHSGPGEAAAAAVLASDGQWPLFASLGGEAKSRSTAVGSAPAPTTPALTPLPYSPYGERLAGKGSSCSSCRGE
jgi:hypothetical protein